VGQTAGQARLRLQRGHAAPRAGRAARPAAEQSCGLSPPRHALRARPVRACRREGRRGACRRARRDALHRALAAQQGAQLRALVQASLDAYVAFFEGQAVAAPAALPALLAARAWDRPAAFTVELVAEGGAAVLRPPAAAAAAAAAGAIDAAVAAAAGLPCLTGALAAAAGRGPGGRELNPSKPSGASPPPPPLAAMPAADPAVGVAKAAVSAAVLAGAAAPAALAARFAAFLPLLALAGREGAPDAAAAARPAAEPTAAPDMEDAAAQVGPVLAPLGMVRPGGTRHACAYDPNGARLTRHSRPTVVGRGAPRATRTCTHACAPGAGAPGLRRRGQVADLRRAAAAIREACPDEVRAGVFLVRAAPLKRALAAAAEAAAGALLGRLRAGARAEHDRICETFSAMAAQLTQARRAARVGLGRLRNAHLPPVNTSVRAIAGQPAGSRALCDCLDMALLNSMQACKPQARRRAGPCQWRERRWPHQGPAAISRRRAGRRRARAAASGRHEALPLTLTLPPRQAGRTAEELLAQRRLLARAALAADGLREDAAACRGRLAALGRLRAAAPADDADAAARAAEWPRRIAGVLRDATARVLADTRELEAGVRRRRAAFVEARARFPPWLRAFACRHACWHLGAACAFGCTH